MKIYQPYTLKQGLNPAGAGLGGSSCLSVAIAGALLRAREQVSKKLELSDNEFIQIIQDIETSVIKVPTGCQDYWGIPRWIKCFKLSRVALRLIVIITNM